jgi:hypothetical protein
VHVGKSCRRNAVERVSRTCMVCIVVLPLGSSLESSNVARGAGGGTKARSGWEMDESNVTSNTWPCPGCRLASSTSNCAQARQYFPAVEFSSCLEVVLGAGGKPGAGRIANLHWRRSLGSWRVLAAYLQCCHGGFAQYNRSDSRLGCAQDHRFNNLTASVRTGIWDLS